MTRGFYMLGSGLITQNRTLSAISNNIANSKTNGFKKDIVISSTFEDMMMSRVDKNKTELGTVSMMRSAAETETIHSQGILNPTERTLDFAIIGSGFFAIEDADGETVYSRNGSFNVDEEGYLALSGVGRVMGENGPIQVGTDQITSNESGKITDSEGNVIDTIALYDFENYGDLLTVREGLYNGPNAQRVESQNLLWQTVEGSNVDMGEEMTNSIAAQRVLQSVSQAIKMYDATMQAASTQIAKI